MNQQLSGLEQTTQTTRQNIDAIAAFNAGTLKLNKEQAAIASASGKTLGQVIEELSQLQQASASLGQELGGLDHVVQQDRANLDQMKSDTTTMNRKTPGVS